LNTGLSPRGKPLPQAQREVSGLRASQQHSKEISPNFQSIAQHGRLPALYADCENDSLVIEQAGLEIVHSNLKDRFGTPNLL
jgi:hypothetical protein